MSVPQTSNDIIRKKSLVRLGEESVEQNEQVPAFERFLNNFLREQNIRWMLVIGAGIIFASSLMLVARNFPTWHVSLKYLAVLGYTAVIFGAGEIGRSRFGLQATSKVLHVLTLFLLPVCFLALHWATSAGSESARMSVAAAIGFGIPAAGFLGFAAARIFDHLLRGRQTTFVVAYVLLCLAGALPLLTNPIAAFVVSLLLWAVMTAGMIKVNRYLFWMAEEQHWPRIFGFFPSMLLGCLFVIMMVANTGRALSSDWIGFGCVLMSATILMTARTVADVFRRRTGDIVRPLPLSIVLPLVAGLVCLTVGIGLSFTGLLHLMATVPTCLVATGILAVAAKETRHPAFVWATLVTGTLTYQFTPTLFREAALSLRDAAAASLELKRLPAAFYGLTYLPLIVGITALYARLNSKSRFQSAGMANLIAPLRIFGCSLAVILQIIALTHPGAMFIVSAANVGTFLLIGAMLKERSVAAISLISLSLATATAVPFFAGASGRLSLGLILSQYNAEIGSCLGLLGCLLVVTRFADLILQRIPLSPKPSETAAPASVNHMGEITGLGLSIVVGVYWLASLLQDGPVVGRLPTHLLHGILPAVTFFTYVLRRKNVLSGFIFWLLLLVAAVDYALEAGCPVSSLLSAGPLVLGLPAIAGAMLMRNRSSNSEHPSAAGVMALMQAQMSGHTPAISHFEAFLIPLNNLCLCMLAMLTGFYYLPGMVAQTVNYASIAEPIAASLAVLWLLVATFVMQSRVAGVLSAVTLPLLCSALLQYLSPTTILSWGTIFSIWAAAASVCYPLFSSKRSDATDFASIVSRVWMFGTLAVSLTSYDLEYRLVALTVPPMLWFMADRQLSRQNKTILAVLANIHAILLIAGLCGADGMIFAIQNVRSPLMVTSIFVSIVASLAVFAIYRDKLEHKIVDGWLCVLRVIGAIAVMGSFAGLQYAPAMTVLMLMGFTGAIALEFWNAVNEQKESRVWLAIVMGAVAGVWAVMKGAVPAGPGMLQVVMFAGALISLTIAEKTRGLERAGILSRPLRLTGMTLPLFVILIAIARTVLPGFTSRGLPALVVFGCAGLYFHQWILSRQRGFLLLAGASLNVAFVLLWRSLNVNDPQFYMVPMGLSVLGLVQILKKELPAAAHDPVRYIGALMILVSPVFDIMSTGSWLHLMSLLVLSTMVVLLSIGLRLKALMYTGTAFIVADLAVMMFQANVDHPGFLWMGGLFLGVFLLTLAAFCERHREQVLAQIRKLSSALAAWE